MVKQNKILGQKVIFACLTLTILLFFSDLSMGQDTIKLQTLEHPLDPDKILDDIVPKPGELINIGVPDAYFDWKDKVYNNIGLKFGASYQLLFQAASDIAPDATYNTALAH